MSDPLVFVATVEKVQTMTDGAIRVYLDLAETEIGVMAALVGARVAGVALQIEAREYEGDDGPKSTKIHI